MVKNVWWYLVTNDKYELPITPICDSPKELAEFANDLGFKVTSKSLREKYYKEERKTNGAPYRGVYKVIRLEHEESDNI